jgi:ribosomal-protein-alanine N-acetyltransferase
MGGDARSAARGAVSWTIRPAVAADLPAIIDIENGAFSDPWSAKSFGTMIAAPHTTFTVLVDRAGAVGGYGILLLVPPDADVANIAVAPRLRQQGAGRLLLSHLLAEARAAGVRVVHLEVRESNLAAQRLYARLGFTIAGRRRGYYQQPREDALVLRTTLSAPGE